MEQRTGKVEKIGQEQIHELLFEESLSWQSIIYDLINSEQIDPWDIDLSLLAQKYLEKIREFEEENFFVSSKVLLAASLLLRIKSEILLSEYIPSIDKILFGRKEHGAPYEFSERIELDEDVPSLIPRTPLPRFKRVSLEELMSALGKAIKTETRRIKRVVLLRQQEMETGIAVPRNSLNMREHIKAVYDKIKEFFSGSESRMAFSELVEAHGKKDDRRKKIASFVALLHLDTQQKVWLEQENHLEEIWILLKSSYEKKNKELLEKMRKEVEEYMKKEPELKDEAPERGAQMHGAEENEDGEDEIPERKVSLNSIRAYTGFGRNVE